MLDPQPAKQAKPVRVMDRILSFLRQHPDETFNTQGIMQGLGMPERTVIGGLANLHNHRSVERPGPGWWKYKPRSRGAGATEATPTSHLAIATEPSPEPDDAQEWPKLAPGEILEVFAASPIASAHDEHGRRWYVFAVEEWVFIWRHLLHVSNAINDASAAYLEFWTRYDPDDASEDIDPETGEIFEGTATKNAQGVSDCQRTVLTPPDTVSPPGEPEHPGEIAMYLRQLREARAYELDVLSVKSTIPEARLRSFEHGRAQPTRDQIVLLARAYRMGAKELSCFLGHGTNLYGFDEGGEDG